MCIDAKLDQRYTKTMQKIATQVFIYASVAFGVLGILVVIFQPENDNALLSKLLMATVFVILPSFALSVAGKYLKK
jgi:hypothetical protein